MLKQTLLRSAFAAIDGSGLARLLDPVWGGTGVIFCLHHVLPGGGLQKGFAPNTNLEITPEFLDALIGFVRTKGYDTIAISEIPKHFAKPVSSRRFAVFTLDDGYMDNLVHAMPVFTKHRCPFAVYVAPRIAEGTCELWWRVLEAVISKADAIKSAPGYSGVQMATATDEQKWKAWHRLFPQVQKMPEYDQRKWITALAASHDIDLESLCRNAAMGWEDIKGMAQNPLATIGAHTLNHYNLHKLPHEDAKREIVRSGEIVSERLGRRVKHFAYPYGNRDAAGPREFQLAEASGYETAVVTRLGPVTSEHAVHLHALPRIMISGRYQDLRFINALLSGVPSRMSNGFSGLNVN
jgi:peptidoglycan/xylan/chitin deacetylase (PgdA/CDA1 family)